MAVRTFAKSATVVDVPLRDGLGVFSLEDAATGRRVDWVAYGQALSRERAQAQIYWSASFYRYGVASETVDPDYFDHRPFTRPRPGDQPLYDRGAGHREEDT